MVPPEDDPAFHPEVPDHDGDPDPFAVTASGWTHPDDRLWRHPSERSASSGPGVTGQGETDGSPNPVGPAGTGSSRRNRRRSVLLVATAGVVLIAGTFVALTFNDTSTTSGSAEGADHPENPSATLTTLAGMNDLVTTSQLHAISSTLGPSVVSVEEARPGGAVEVGTGVASGGNNMVVTTLPSAALGHPIVLATATGQLVAATVVGRDATTGITALHADDQIPRAPLATPGALRTYRTGSSVALVAEIHPERNRASTMTFHEIVVDTALANRAAPNVPGGTPGRTGSGTSAVPSPVVIAQDGEGHGLSPSRDGSPLVDAVGRIFGLLVPATNGNPASTMAFWPIGMVEQVTRDLVSTGRVTSGSWGATLGADARITGVTPGGPAQRAGLKAGDSLLRLDGWVVHTGEDVVDLLYGRPAGSTVTATIERSGSVLHVRVALQPAS
jgi:putative serine protease PepD